MPLLTTWAGGMTGNFPDLLRALTLGPDRTVTEGGFRVLLSSDGATDSDVLAALPRDIERAQRRAGPGGTPGAPDPKRYRDLRQLVRTAGLAYDEEVAGVTEVRVTALGKELMRWADDGIDASNVRVIARHAARTLSAVQLRNPTPDGRKYSSEIEVFPFAFIWRAMIALGGRISREELNRGIYRTKNEADLISAIERIRFARIEGNIDVIGEPAFERGEDGSLTARRVRGWMSWASFGWTLIADEQNSEVGFQIASSWAEEILRDAAAVVRRHREFSSVGDYVEHLSHCAGISQMPVYA